MKHPKENFKGTIQHLSLSPHGDPEGLVLEDGTFVKVPPHSLVKKESFAVGEEVTGEGHLINEEPNRVFHHARVKLAGAIIADDSLPEPEREKLKEKHKADLKNREDAEDEKLTVKGKVVAIGTKPKGEVDRIILADGTSVHVPKDLDSDRSEWAIGASVEVKGKARRYGEGRFLKAESIKHI